MQENDKENLIEQILGQFRVMSTQAVMRSQLIAGKLGLNSTDLETIEVLYRNGRSTAGKLSDETGLTTGAITGVIDRLERAGYVKREPDPADRRKVLVSLNHEIVDKKVIPLFSSISASIEKNLLVNYSREELELFCLFLEESVRVSEEDLANLGNRKV